METNDRDRLDQWLDSALRQFGNAQPRAGLEGRIMANLSASATDVHVRKRWAWNVLVASAAVLLIGLRISIEHFDQRTNHKVTVSSQGSDEQRRLQSIASPPPSQRSRRHELVQAPQTFAAADEPRVAQFPSSRKLSEQELLFLSYVERFPQEAKLMAQEQQQFENEIQEAQP